MSMVLDKDTLMNPKCDIYFNDIILTSSLRRCVTSIEFEESDSDADLIRLSVEDTSNGFSTNSKLDKGMEIKLVFGHANNTREVTGIVSLIEADYTDIGEEILTIVAIDKTNVMTSVKKSRKWTKVKRSDVVKEIASVHGFKSIVKDTEEIHPTITQDDETDAQFILKLANEEALQFYLIQETDTIYFDERFKDFKIADTLYYKSGDFSIISFKPNLVSKNKKQKIDKSDTAKNDVSDNTGGAVDDKTKDENGNNEARNMGIDSLTGAVEVQDSSDE